MGHQSSRFCWSNHTLKSFTAGSKVSTIVCVHEVGFFNNTGALNNVPTQQLGGKNLQTDVVGFCLTFLIGIWCAV